MKILRLFFYQVIFASVVALVLNVVGSSAEAAGQPVDGKTTEPSAGKTTEPPVPKTSEPSVLKSSEPPVRATDCEVKTEDGYTQIFKGTGDSKRNPTMEEVFDGMNVEGSTLFKDLLFEEEKESQPLLYVEVDGKEPLYYNFISVPKKGKKDDACSDKKITGYQCRLKELKSKYGKDRFPGGLRTGVIIKIPEGDQPLMQRISKGLACTKVLLPSGAPLDQKTTRPPLKIVPVDSSGTTQ